MAARPNGGGGEMLPLPKRYASEHERAASAAFDLSGLTSGSSDSDDNVLGVNVARRKGTAAKVRRSRYAQPPDNEVRAPKNVPSDDDDSEEGDRAPALRGEPSGFSVCPRPPSHQQPETA